MRRAGWHLTCVIYVIISCYVGPEVRHSHQALGSRPALLHSSTAPDTEKLGFVRTSKYKLVLRQVMRVLGLGQTITDLTSPVRIVRPQLGNSRWS